MGAKASFKMIVGLEIYMIVHHPDKNKNSEHLVLSLTPSLAFEFI
jgi:hypothetical protein